MSGSHIILGMLYHLVANIRGCCVLEPFDTGSGFKEGRSVKSPPTAGQFHGRSGQPMTVNIGLVTSAIFSLVHCRVGKGFPEQASFLGLVAGNLSSKSYFHLPEPGTRIPPGMLPLGDKYIRFFPGPIRKAESFHSASFLASGKG